MPWPELVIEHLVNEMGGLVSTGTSNSPALSIYLERGGSWARLRASL